VRLAKSNQRLSSKLKKVVASGKNNFLINKLSLPLEHLHSFPREKQHKAPLVRAVFSAFFEMAHYEELFISAIITVIQLRIQLESQPDVD